MIWMNLSEVEIDVTFLQVLDIIPLDKKLSYLICTKFQSIFSVIFMKYLGIINWPVTSHFVTFGKSNL